MAIPRQDSVDTLDFGALRHAFDRLAPTYRETAEVQREIADRMLSRLDLVRVEPSHVLDAGAGPGDMAVALAARYPKAMLLAVDVSHGMLRQIGRPSRLERWLGKAPGGRVSSLCCDFQQLPLAGASVDMVVSNLALTWAQDIGRALSEWLRVLKPGGLLMFTALGPDSINAWRSHRPKFLSDRLLDMHDLGDLLVHQGYTAPVMDQERLQLSYSNPGRLMQDLRGWGALNCTLGRPKGLAGRSAQRALFGTRAQWGECVATLEVVYGHAWKPSGPSPTGKSAEGHAIIRFDRALRKR